MSATKTQGEIMDKQNNKFSEGLRDGIPICLGYLSVAFAFGIFSVGSGLSVLETVLISMTNVTSAGQLAAVPIIAAGGSLFELALTQFVINLRYSLMSVSLSQKLGSTVRLIVPRLRNREFLTSQYQHLYPSSYTYSVCMHLLLRREHQ